MHPITLQSRWPDLLGETKADMPDNIRRYRWEQWKALCAKEPDGKEIIEQWTTAERCAGCIHKDNDWCKLQQLPCTVNPVLTYQYNMKGLACMGIGYESQMKMFLRSNDEE